MTREDYIRNDWNAEDANDDAAWSWLRCGKSLDSKCLAVCRLDKGTMKSGNI